MIGPGSRIGVYEVTARIGMGGMGVVYRAKDTSLGREVAIKVLPDAFVSQPERTARFKREATTLGALNHPNIASIYGLQESDGVLALVLEFVEGPTLADRLAAGGLPIHQALPIARQIADALEAAHDRTPFSLSDVTVRENNLTFMLAAMGRVRVGAVPRR